MTDDSQKDAKLVIPYYTIRTENVEIPPELAYEMAAILIEWGAFENVIYIDLETLRNYPQVSRLAPVIPNGFARKIELWKKSIIALFNGVPVYTATAREICSKGKIVARARHRLIHGVWRPDESKPGTFDVLSGIDRPKDLADFKVDTKFAAGVHQDIKMMTNAAYGFLMTRMMHAAQGLLTAHPAPSPDSQAHPNLPTGGKPQPPPESPQ